MAAVRTRFAPSPTGDLHLGGAWTALASWAFARAQGGVSVLRMEDVDTPRVVRDSAERIRDDLAWLGLSADEGPSLGGPYAPYTQSERTPLYEAALSRLLERGLLYPCDCSRAEIARVASAPHAGEEVLYPGTCRDASPNREFKRLPAWRIRTPAGHVVRFRDGIHGDIQEVVAEGAGDFVLRRGDGVFAYQFVVAVDDAAMRISHVIRADDLLASTARQILLMELLETGFVPNYLHLPLVVQGGERLAKRAKPVTVRRLKDAGVAPEAIVGALAAGLGLVPGPVRPMAPEEVARSLCEPSKWARSTWQPPDAWTTIT